MKLGPIGWILYVFYRARMWASKVKFILVDRDTRKAWLRGDHVIAIRRPKSGMLPPAEVLAICHAMGIDPERVFEAQRREEEGPHNG